MEGLRRWCVRGGRCALRITHRLRTGNDRQCVAHHDRVLEISRGDRRDVLRLPVRKRLARHAVHGVRLLRVHIRALKIRNAGGRIRARSAAPPLMWLLVRRERNPTDVPDRSAAAEADERNERRRIRLLRFRARAGRPRPAIAVTVAMPAAVVERRIAPVGIIHPRPAVIRFGNPPARRIRRPVSVDVGDPFVAVVGIVLPLSVTAERVEAGNAR